MTALLWSMGGAAYLSGAVVAGAHIYLALDSDPENPAFWFGTILWPLVAPFLAAAMLSRRISAKRELREAQEQEVARLLKELP